MAMHRRRAAKDNHSLVPSVDPDDQLAHGSASASASDNSASAFATGGGAMSNFPHVGMFPPHAGMTMNQMAQFGQQYKTEADDVGAEEEADGAPAAARSRQSRKAQVAAKQSQKARAHAATKRKLPDSDDDEGDSEDDEELGTVPDGKSAADIAKNKYNHIEDEKERKRLKRLLRNRVSAQQARERKKAYMYTLENTKKETENRVAGLEQQVNKLERENFMLRQVVKSTTKGDYGEM